MTVPILLELFSVSLSISIAGAQGRLGRELVLQSLERGFHVRGIVRRPYDPVFVPTRKGWLSPDPVQDARRVPIVSSRLSLTTNTTCHPSTDVILFVMSSQPFATKLEMQVQNEVVRNLCGTSRLTNCSKLCLVSAFGSGDSLPGSNIGYKIMHDFYLKEGYAAKEVQESIVSRLGTKTRNMIMRPKALSFEPIPLNTFTVSRYDLAKRILDWVEEEEEEEEKA